MSQIDWQDEAAKWKRLSRKNEARARLNLARAESLEAQLKKALTPPDLLDELAALTQQIEAREREVRYYTRLMQEIPGVRSKRVSHRS